METTIRQAPERSATRRRTSHCATAARRNAAPCVWSMPAAAALHRRRCDDGDAVSIPMLMPMKCGHVNVAYIRIHRAQQNQSHLPPVRVFAVADRDRLFRAHLRATAILASSLAACSGSSGRTARYTCAQSGLVLPSLSAPGAETDAFPLCTSNSYTSYTCDH